MVSYPFRTPLNSKRALCEAIWNAVVILAGIILAACGMVPGAVSGSGAPTAAPTATLDAAGYRSVPSQACLLVKLTTMQTNKAQGDLIAWQPGSAGNDNFAFLTSAERSSWFVGELTLAKGPDYKTLLPLAPSILATGDLTWSPSGETLAFTAFRPNENVNTVMTVRADGSGLTDLFPTDLARTDTRTSQKAIIGWKDENTLQVISACGEECRNAYDINASGPEGPVLTPTPIGDYTELSTALKIHRREIEHDPLQYPRIISTPSSIPHWSPADHWVAYLDKRLLLWVLSPSEKITYPVDIGLRDVAETQWSEDETRLAVRAEDAIFVFEINCSPGK